MPNFRADFHSTSPCLFVYIVSVDPIHSEKSELGQGMGEKCQVYCLAHSTGIFVAIYNYNRFNSLHSFTFNKRLKE